MALWFPTERVESGGHDGRRCFFEELIETSTPVGIRKMRSLATSTTKCRLPEHIVYTQKSWFLFVRGK